jgi:hypothetical protein
MILLGLAFRQDFHSVSSAQLVPPCTSSLNHTVTFRSIVEMERE